MKHGKSLRRFSKGNGNKSNAQKGAHDGEYRRGEGKGLVATGRGRRRRRRNKPHAAKAREGKNRNRGHKQHLQSNKWYNELNEQWLPVQLRYLVLLLISRE